MGKTIEVRLNDAQYAALVAEADASGQKFFEHCRTKLVAGHQGHYGTSPLKQRLPEFRRENEAKLAEARIREAQRIPPYIIPEPDDRIDRIERAVAALTDVVMGAQIVPPQPDPALAEPLDIDSIVDAQFAQAEAAGLTEMVPDPIEEEMQNSGVRAISRRPVPFSGANTPRHLQSLLG